MNKFLIRSVYEGRKVHVLNSLGGLSKIHLRKLQDTTLSGGKIGLKITHDERDTPFESFQNPLSHLLKTFLIRFKFFNEILLKLKTEIP